MPKNNHVQRFRPLRAGTRIINGVCMNPGTLGFIGVDSAGAFWLVSCRHVLVRPKGWSDTPFAAGEPIYQPSKRVADSLVGRTVTGRANTQLDCAAAPLLDGTQPSAEALGLGEIANKPVAAKKNMFVVKSGMKTGVTEGRITKITGSTVQILPPKDFPDDYQLCDPGDSGALWLEKDTLAPVALHRAGNVRGPEFARASAIKDVLKVLNLKSLYHE
ncbi:MAG: hypothetical protein PVI86_02105 [Phycisphaerae bacterium]|jgi:hypothetical protein